LAKRLPGQRSSLTAATVRSTDHISTPWREGNERLKYREYGVKSK
jgi:hypothetical protein